MKKFGTAIIVILVLVIGIFIAGPFFIIHEGEQAVVVQFGRIKENGVVTSAGLHLKIPVIDEVHRFSKKIISWDGEPMSMHTAERLEIFVDVTARWRISDPRVFYEAVRTMSVANDRLSQVIESAVRTIVVANPLIESVRNSNIIMELPAGVSGQGDDIEAEIAALQSGSGHEPIVRGRRQLAEEMLARSRQMVPQYGIELIDVVTRQIRYSPALTENVYNRMVSERNQIAQFYRSDGEGRKAEWIGRMESERMSLLSAAYQQAQTIMGEADAEAARIYAGAYSQNRAFFEFWRAIESYRATMQNLDKTMSTDMDYFRYLHSVQGR